MFRGFDSTTTYQSIMEIGFDIVRVGRVVELVREKLLTLPPPAHLRNSSNLDLSWLLRVIISSLIFGLHFFSLSYHPSQSSSVSLGVSCNSVRMRNFLPRFEVNHYLKKVSKSEIMLLFSIFLIQITSASSMFE